MKLVKCVNDFRIYELEEMECTENYRCYPCFVCWLEKVGTLNDDIGNLLTTENECGSLDDMIAWCENN